MMLRAALSLLLFLAVLVLPAVACAEQSVDKEFEREVAQLNLTDVDAVIALARKYIALERFDLADEIFSRALAKKPRNFLFYQVYGDYLVRRGRINDAIDILETCRELNIVSYGVELLLGRLYFKKQNYRKAARAFEKAAQVNRIYDEPLFFWAVSATFQGLEGEPSRVIQLLAERFPSSPLLPAAKAVRAYYHGDFATAVELLDGVKDSPSLPAFCHIVRGAALMMLARFDEASAALDKAAAVDPVADGILTDRAILLIRSGKAANASSLLDEARRYEDLHELWMARAYLLISAGRLDDAESLLKEKLRENGKLYYAAYLMGVLLSRRMDALRKKLAAEDEKTVEEKLRPLADSAVEYLRACTTYGKDFFAGYYLLGRFFFLRGEYAQALAQFEKAARLAPKNLSVQVFVGHCYLALSRWSEAKRTFEAVLQQQEKNSHVLDCLGYIEATTGDINAAQKYFEAALAVNRNDAYARAQLKRLKELKKMMKGG